MAVERLPELARPEALMPWAQNLIRTMTSWVAFRPVIKTGSLTLSVDPAKTTTTLTDRLITPSSVIDLIPVNAAAAGSLGTGWYPSSVPGGKAVIIHQASSLTRTYKYLIVG